jgi:hypothetical protein
MYDEHEPAGTDVRFEDIAVLMPKIAGEVEEPPASNAAGEGDRTHSGRMHDQGPPSAMRVRVSEPCAAVYSAAL